MMAQEIERKFLVINDAWRGLAQRHARMRQGYLSNSAACSIRVRVTDESAFLNIKSATIGVTRTEFEYAIPRADADEMLERFCQGRCLAKTRYYVPIAPHVWEIDVFEGVNAGLVVAEIELSAADEMFDRPSWVGAEVSDDPRYYNVRLIEHPYAAWGQAAHA
jgi:adenylate cyclase